MQRFGSSAPSGTLVYKVKKRQVVPGRELSFREILKYGFPSPGCGREAALWRLRNFPNLWRGLWKVALARLFRIPTFYGQLAYTKTSRNGQVVDLGLVSLRVVTTAGVNFIRDSFLNTKELENMKFHGFGTGTNAEAVGDTALQTELTTQYLVDNTRPTGSQVSGGAGAYQTVATLAPDSGGTIAVTEHGIFDQAATGAGTMLDRTVGAAVNLVAGTDSLIATYTYTTNAGS